MCPDHWSRGSIGARNALIGWLKSRHFKPIFLGRAAIRRRQPRLGAALDGFDLLRRSYAGGPWLRQA